MSNQILEKQVEELTKLRKLNLEQEARQPWRPQSLGGCRHQLHGRQGWGGMLLKTGTLVNDSIMNEYLNPQLPPQSKQTGNYPSSSFMREKLNERPSRPGDISITVYVAGDSSFLVTMVSRESPHPEWYNLASLGHLHHTQVFKYVDISPLPTSTTLGNWWFLLWRNLTTNRRQKTQLSILGISNITRPLLYFYMWKDNKEWLNIWEMSLSEIRN